MGVISTSTHPKELWPGLYARWGRIYKQHEPQWKKLFDIKTSTQQYEETLQNYGFPLAPVISEGNPFTYATDGQGYTTRFTHVSYGLGFIVTYNEMKDNLYEKKGGTRAEGNAFVMRQTKEIVLANIYNRAFNSSYVYGDGKELLATDHPSQAGTWSNELSTPADLSETAVEDMMNMINTATDEMGHQINLNAISLHIHPDNLWDAHRIFKSVLQNDTANNATNALLDTKAIPGGICMNNYFTDSKAWFIRTDAQNGMTLFERDSYPLRQDNDFDTDNVKAKSFMRFSGGCSDPRALYGSAGA